MYFLGNFTPHSVVISEIFPHFKNFSSNWFAVQLFSEKVDLTEFLQKIVEEKFANFHTDDSLEITEIYSSLAKISWKQQRSLKQSWFHEFILRLHTTVQCGNLQTFPPRFFAKIPSNQLFH